MRKLHSLAVLCLVFAIGTKLGQVSIEAGDHFAFAREKTLDRFAQPWIGNPVSGICFHGQVTASQLVLALGAGFDARQSGGDSEVDRLIVANLEMQRGVMFYRSPVAAVEAIAADKVERARDIAAGSALP